jgi:hypothetical protein
MGLGALAVSRSRRDLVARLACAGVVVAALAAAGIFHYLYAIGLNTASHAFYQELMDFMSFSAPSWHVFRDDIAQVLMNPLSIRTAVTIDALVAPLAQVAALYLAAFGRTREARIFGRTVVIWVVATALTIALLHNFYYYTGIMYQGPDPRHLVHILWPYYAICLAVPIADTARGLAALLAQGSGRMPRLPHYALHGAIVLVLTVPPFVVYANRALGLVPPNRGLARSQAYTAERPPFTGYRRTPIIDYLEREAAIRIGEPFRGSVVAMPSDYYRDLLEFKAWRRERTFAFSRSYLGNDMGAYGLRHYNIPTLDQLTHNIAPHFYLTVRELLSRPGIDAYDKHFALVTRLNEPVMALLGLRYIIADHEIPFGTQRLAMPIPEDARRMLEAQRLSKSPLRVYELRDPNLGHYSPTAVVPATTAREAILAMAAPGFDGRNTVVVEDPAIGRGLVPATGASMTVQLGGVALRASSSGESVLVLPVQFSHCWRVVSGGPARLFRANLMQLGVRFSGELSLELRQIFGPFWQSGCRLADAGDAERLRMAEALGAGAEPHKIPGDGINLIGAPEALDRTIGNSAVASVRAAGDRPSRGFTVAAVGGLSEHYAVLRIPRLVPGPYTLSLQVRADSAHFMALQINDGGNGAFADYLLPKRNVWVKRLGRAEKINATIDRLDADWLQLTLTSTVAADSANVFIHVKDRGNRGTFSPAGESVTIRAVKFERGETATPVAAQPDPPPRSRAPGDGRNIIPDPERLESAVGSSEMARFEPVSGTDRFVRQYRLAATGGNTEHFVVINGVPVEAGAHTFSLQVKPAGAKRLRLQMLDASSHGVIADYDLAAVTASLTGLVGGENQDAAVRTLNGGWLSVSLTSGLQAGISRIIIQLMGADGSNGFAPNGEAVVLRATKLERGENATPYPGLDR